MRDYFVINFTIRLKIMIIILYSRLAGCKKVLPEAHGMPCKEPGRILRPWWNRRGLSVPADLSS